MYSESSSILLAGVQPRSTPFRAKPRDVGLNARDAFSVLRQRLSSRMSRYLALDPHELNADEPLVSFTFDDAPVTAATLGAPMLEAYGARGTYYIATGLLGQKTEDFALIDADGVRDLHRGGHEIGLHTHDHQRAHVHTPKSFAADLERNRAFLRAIDPTIAPAHFAYPFGAISLSLKRAMPRLAATSRGILSGVNFGRFDAQNIRTVELADKRLTRAELDHCLEETRRRRGWLVFLSHDISKSPSDFGCSPDLFASALDGAAKRGLRFATMSQAFAQSRPLCAPRVHSPF